MEPNIDVIFENIDVVKKPLTGHEFDGCTFKGCNFANYDLSGFNFMDCIFEYSNLSMVGLSNTNLNNVTFIDCKMMGTDFSRCNDMLLSVSFTRCQLDYTFYYKKKLKKTKFIECSIKESNFTETDLSGSVFDKCDLSRSVFEHTNLSQVDFRTAVQYSINPDINQIKKAKFSLEGIVGLLGKYDIVIE